VPDERGSYWFVVALSSAHRLRFAHSVNDYAQGPPFVRVNGRWDLTTSTGGTAMEVSVKQGSACAKAGARSILYRLEQRSSIT